MRPIAAAASLVLASAPALALAADPGAAAADPEPGVAVTVYSAPGGFDPNNMQNVYDPMTGQWAPRIPGFSIVKERRRIQLAEGRNEIRFEDVAAKIDGSTVSFKSLTDPAGTSVLEQSFEFDLASADRILERYVGREVDVMQKDNAEYRGRLLSFDARFLVLDQKGEVVVLERGENLKRISLAGLPGGLVTKPTLAWVVQAGKPGDHLAEVAYETSGMSWNADYTAIISPDERSVDLSAWVTIRNQSGATFRDAGLKLVAGDLNRAPRQGNTRGYDEMAGMAAKSAGVGGFTEKAFFEYHLYTLGRRTTLPDRSLKQIELFDPVAGAPCRKVFLYDGLRDQPWWGGGGPNEDQNFGATGNKKVGVFLEIENRKENGLGMPLPAGRMRVHKRDEADGFPELIGEDGIDHTPKDEKVRLKMGDAFDVVGERKQTAFEVNGRERWMRETVEIRIRNHKAEPVEVLVAERMFRWLNWTIEKKSQDVEKKDSRLVHFPVKVEKDGETVVTYTVKYSW
jgi:hypothetical protein